LIRKKGHFFHIGTQRFLHLPTRVLAFDANHSEETLVLTECGHIQNSSVLPSTAGPQHFKHFLQIAAISFLPITTIPAKSLEPNTGAYTTSGNRSIKWLRK